MPELPEVEICVRNLQRWTHEASIHDCKVEEPRSLKYQTPREYRSELVGRRVCAARRIGKHALIELEEDRLLWIHLGMSGKVVRIAGRAIPDRVTSESRKPTSEHRHVRIYWRFGTPEGHLVLALNDPRIFGRTVAGRSCEVREALHLSQLGPDALGISGDQLRVQLDGSRQAIKTALMDQSKIAGLGNIHASEALWHAEVAPVWPCRSLKDESWSRLATGIEATFERTLNRDSSDTIHYVSEGAENYFWVYQKNDTPCPRCGAPIKKMQLGGRATYYCAHCQPTEST
ncbi:MAG: DNA-formamidopyrimidine glycosylase family protein [Myxococcota bacterium]